MNNVVLAVLGNGRKDLLAQTVNSLNEKVQYPFIKKIMIDDTTDMNYSNYLHAEYGNEFHIISHIVKRGLSGSIQSLWNASSDADYIVHVEEDFLFNEPVDIDKMINVLQGDDHIAQIALKRQPCNPAEIEAGGFMQLAPHTYQLRVFDQINYVVHRNFFTLNPSVYPKWVMQLGWEDGWGEKEFGERLFANELTQCAYLGKIEDAPLVHHTGDYRAENWVL